MKNLLLISAALIAATANAQIGGSLKDLRTAAESARSISQKKMPEGAATVSGEEKEMDDRLTSLFGEYQSYKTFFYEFQRYVKLNDKVQISKLISYPIDISGRKISDATQFLEYYDLVFSEKLRSEIEKEKYPNLFAKATGVMLANGALWYSGLCVDKSCKSQKIMVTAINSDVKLNAASAKSGNLNFGYLKGSIKVFEGAGCGYFKISDEKVKNPKPIGSDDYDGKGIVFNINGVDRLFKDKSRAISKIVVENEGVVITIPAGKTKSCGKECSIELSNLEVQKADKSKEIIPIFSMCGS